jgi:hypothetical protein
LHEIIKKLFINDDWSRRTSLIIFIFGLILFCGVQGYLAISPLASRSGLPEYDDTLNFLVRTEIMRSCPDNDCPAIKDLKGQLYAVSKNQKINEVRGYGHFVFPRYHFLFSWLLRGIDHFTNDLISAYRVLWYAAPFIFAVCIAYFMTMMFGLPAGGLSLWALAFTVFPSNGIHLIVPSVISLIVALVLWGRIYQAVRPPYISFIVLSCLSILFHPIGIGYCLIACFILVYRHGLTGMNKILIVSAMLVGVACVVLFYNEIFPNGIIASFFSGNADIANPKTPKSPLLVLGLELFRARKSIIVSLPLYLLAIVFGYIYLGFNKQQNIKATLYPLLLIMLMTLFFIHPAMGPGDLFLRFVIPLIMMSVGLAATCCLGGLRFAALEYEKQESPSKLTNVNTKVLWHLSIAVLSAGLIANLIMSGAEIVEIVAQHYKYRFPYNFSEEQVAKVLNDSEPDDRIVYTTRMGMAAFLIYGGLKRGAVYADKIFDGDQTTDKFVTNPRNKYVVSYNPSVYVDDFRWMDEKRWSDQLETSYYSPVYFNRYYNQPHFEGMVSGKNLDSIKIVIKDIAKTKSVKIKLVNMGKRRSIISKSTNRPRQIIDLPSKEYKDLVFEISPNNHLGEILLSNLDQNIAIKCIKIDESSNNWPWNQKCIVYVNVFTRVGLRQRRIDFDIASLIPSSLESSNVYVFDDSGSLVVLKMN